MEKSNICMFNTLTPQENASFNILHFVYEKKAVYEQHVIIFAAFSINLVTKGKGYFTLNKNKYDLKEGDLFFTFPSVPTSTVNEDNLEYMYISFTGTQAMPMLERAQISKDNPVIHGMQHLAGFWTDSLGITNENNIDIISQSVILYSLSSIITEGRKSKTTDKAADIVCKIKQTVDKEYFSPELNLNRICAEFFYNPSYISFQFKKIVGVSFNEYLQNLRLQNALRLIKNGYTQVKDVAITCGFSDPLYFSKVFKKKYGISPGEYISTQKNLQP